MSIWRELAGTSQRRKHVREHSSDGSSCFPPNQQLFLVSFSVCLLLISRGIFLPIDEQKTVFRFLRTQKLELSFLNCPRDPHQPIICLRPFHHLSLTPTHFSALAVICNQSFVSKHWDWLLTIGACLSRVTISNDRVLSEQLRRR